MTRVWRLFGLHKSVSAPAAAAASAPEPEAKRHKNDAHEQPVVEESAAGNEEEEGDEEREANVMSSQEEDDHEEDEEEEAGAELAECEGEEEQWMRAKAVRAGQMVVPKGQEFKQVPDTRFIVDGFKLRDLPGNCTYFLTHFHSDHYGGIGCKWNAPIYCSPITGRLLVQSLGVPRDLIRELRLNETVVIQGVRVTVFDANHCPGALLILFETSVSTTLHVGDFRWNKRILAESPRLAEFKPRQLTHLFLDTTFNNPRYDFPPQEEVIACAVELVRAVLAQHRNPLFRFGAYSIGKEKVFLAVAKALNQKIYASAEKQKLLRAYCPDMSVFVSDKDAAKLHVTGLGKSGFDGLKGLEAALGAKHDAYVGISPTGWNWGERGNLMAAASFSRVICFSQRALRKRRQKSGPILYARTAESLCTGCPIRSTLRTRS